MKKKGKGEEKGKKKKKKGEPPIVPALSRKIAETASDDRSA